MAKNFPKLTDPRKLRVQPNTLSTLKKKKKTTSLRYTIFRQSKDKYKILEEATGKEEHFIYRGKRITVDFSLCKQEQSKLFKVWNPITTSEFYIRWYYSKWRRNKGFFIEKKKKTDKFISSRPVLQKNGKKIFKQKKNDIGQKPGST